ncbi:MAG: DUF1003 domain-containing protein [Gemmatimonadaceae bacterium]
MSNDEQSSFPDLPAGGASMPGNAERRSARHVANRAYMAIKAQRAADRTRVEDIAESLNEFASSTPFLIFHAIWFLIWLPWNIGAFRPIGLEPFDPYPFGLLTMIVSLEAIFLSIFVLLAQKREAAIAELREELSLQVGLWTEQEVTKTLQLVTGLYRRLGHPLAEDVELRQMLGPLDVHGIEARLLAEIDSSSRSRSSSGPSISKPERAKAETRPSPDAAPAAASPIPPANLPPL